MKRFSFLAIIMAGILMVSCRSLQTSIPYSVADGYFKNNNIKTLTQTVFNSESEFDECFGKAATMGPNGQPTSIDFDKEYVIAVSKPETDIETTIDPVSLKKDSKGNIIFNYKVSKGQRHSYTTAPCLLIVVDKNHSGNVKLKETE